MLQNNLSIVDYGIGNIMSVRRGFEYCGANVCLASTEDEILAADRLILPGVGAFRDGMDALLRLGFLDAILAKAQSGTPILGICLGMQLLFSKSYEFGDTNGLGLIPGEVVGISKFLEDGHRLKIPNIGWRGLRYTEKGRSWENTILEDVTPEDEMYFTHSFTGLCDDEVNLLATSEYGGLDLAAVVCSQNIVGCQFHPEKSGEAGLRVLNSFVENS
jgi:glutamine amidotransferase